MRYGPRVARVRATLTIDEDVLKWVEIRAARTGVSDSAVIEESLRRDLKLDVLDELWSSATLRRRRPPSWRSTRNTTPGLAPDGDPMRAVLDANVLISSVLSSRGASAQLLRDTRDGAFELIVSELLVAELNRALAYPKLGRRIPPEKATAFTGCCETTHRPVTRPWRRGPAPEALSINSRPRPAPTSTLLSAAEASPGTGWWCA